MCKCAYVRDSLKYIHGWVIKPCVSVHVLESLKYIDECMRRSDDKHRDTSALIDASLKGTCNLFRFTLSLEPCFQALNGHVANQNALGSRY